MVVGSLSLAFFISSYKLSPIWYFEENPFVASVTKGEIDKKTWIDFVCHGDGYRIFSGEHVESASAADPSFWSLHASLERFLHAKLMSGGFQTRQWSEDDITSSFVCERSECLELGFHQAKEDSRCCYGHHGEDQYYDPQDLTRQSYLGPRNNEFFNSIDPTSSDYSASYIYDEFSWKHCHKDFASLLTKMAKTSKSRYLK